MNIRSIDGMNNLVRNALSRVPRGTDLIVGIPRSGLIPASLISLYMNLPLTDLDGFLEKRTFAVGLHRGQTVSMPNSIRSILLVDDSLCTGRQMALAIDMIQRCGFDGTLTSLVVYSTLKNQAKADITLDLCELPRIFEWNFMHHAQLLKSCVDIDGLFFRHPNEREEANVNTYIDYLQQVLPQMIPTVPVYCLVTSRSREYREQTEMWLRKHGIRYRCLIMLDAPRLNKEDCKTGMVEYKSKVFVESEASLFIEQDPDCAIQIARRTSRNVLCTQTNTIHG